MRHRKLGGVLLGLAAFLILSGGMLTIAGLALGGRASLYSSDSATEQALPDQYTELAAFQKIEVDVALGDVYLASGGDYGVSLVWENDEHRLHYEVVDGTLRIWDDDTKISGNISIAATATIYFPYDAQFESVAVKTSLGDIQLEGFRAKTLSATNHLGDVFLSDVQAGTAALDLSLGDLEGYGLAVGGDTTVTNHLGDVHLAGSFRALDVDCDMGKVTIATDELERDYTYELATSMGSILLDGERVSGGSTKGGSGAYTLKVDNSMGDIEVLFGEA